MSFSISYSDVDEEDKNLISKLCHIRTQKSQYQKPITHELYVEDEFSQRLKLPLGIWDEIYEEFPNPISSRTTPTKKLVCKKVLYTKETDPKGLGRDQDIVFKEAMARLKSHHTVFLSLPTGFGKTGMGNYIGCKLQHKILVTCLSDTVADQWVDEFKQFSNAKVQRVEGKKGLDPDVDVYVIGTIKASSMDSAYFRCIGTVIFDEAHIATIRAFTSLMFKIRPQYLIGMTATPKRSDGMQTLFYPFFGGKSHFIYRFLKKDFVVRKVLTNFEPVIDYQIVYGRCTVKWATVISSIATNPNRIKFVINMITKEAPGHRVLVLSDRKDECRAIYEGLQKQGLSVGLLIENIKKYPEECNVLVAGMKKAGVGFNDPTLTKLFLMTDVKDVIQFEGRIRTNNNLIIDFVDNYTTFHKHFLIREKWYRKRGASIEIEDHREDKTLIANEIPNTNLLKTKIGIPQTNLLKNKTRIVLTPQKSSVPEITKDCEVCFENKKNIESGNDKILLWCEKCAKKKLV